MVDAGRTATSPADLQYDAYLVAFFDVLGFRKMVEESVDPRAILGNLRFMTELSTPDPDYAAEYDKRTLNFSDTVVRLTRVGSESNVQFPIGIVFHELIDLVHMQMNLVGNGILIRGSVVIGFAHHEPPHLFGPAIVEAYELESKAAKYPRIVVSSEVLDLVGSAAILRSELYTGEEEQENISRLLGTSGDDLLFIDYLRVARSETDDAYEYIEFLSGHRRLVVEGLQRYDSEPSILEKYQWLAHYHNEVIGEFRDSSFEDFGVARGSLFIPEGQESPTSWFSRLVHWLTSASTRRARGIG